MPARGEAIRHRIGVPASEAGTRLDRFLARRVPGLSRTRIQALMAEGHVRAVGGEDAAPGPATRVRAGQVFQVTVPAPKPAAPAAQPMALAIVYEDDDIVVVDKPAGLVVHPAPGNPDRTLVNALLAHCGASLSGIGGVGRPGIVHRLDKDTSGLMVVAKNDAAHRGLAAQLADRRMGRAYYAVVRGVPHPKAGEISGNIGRSPRNRKKMAVLGRGGKPALTRYRVVRAFGKAASLVECRLATGRTHQIRVHLLSRGHPVLGDPLYGKLRAPRHGLDPAVSARISAAGLNRQALHAYLIEFRHPVGGKRLRFESRLPNDIIGLIDQLDAV